MCNPASTRCGRGGGGGFLKQPGKLSGGDTKPLAHEASLIESKHTMHSVQVRLTAAVLTYSLWPWQLCVGLSTAAAENHILTSVLWSLLSIHSTATRCCNSGHAWPEGQLVALSRSHHSRIRPSLFERHCRQQRGDTATAEVPSLGVTSANCSHSLVAQHCCHTSTMAAALLSWPPRVAWV